MEKHHRPNEATKLIKRKMRHKVTFRYHVIRRKGIILFQMESPYRFPIIFACLNISQQMEGSRYTAVYTPVACGNRYEGIQRCFDAFML
ncbi:hypothetical protein TNCV_3771071 [Trichonephila clavipes]|nr:hypothetical protein TNCV_3771071 [Trichonephila clavipes]